MTKRITSRKSGPGFKIAVIVADFNEFVTQRLLAGCLDEFSRHRLSQKNITVVHVPGSFELPVTALKFARKRNIDGVVCLGAVIRGETLHFEMVAYAAAYGITQAALQTGKPVIFGVLTTDTVNQAYKRSQKKGENKGRDAAAAALQMIDLLKRA